MLMKINPTKTSAWKKLGEHYRVMQKMRMADMFRNDPLRSSSFSLRFEDLLVDFSRNIITHETLALAREVFGGILRVDLRGIWWWSLGMTWDLARLVGLEKMLYLMYDNASMVHEVMGILRDGYMA
jgi:hypothetical protein